MTTTGTKEKIGWIVQCHQDYLTYYGKIRKVNKQLYNYLVSLIVNVVCLCFWQFSTLNVSKNLVVGSDFLPLSAMSSDT